MWLGSQLVVGILTSNLISEALTNMKNGSNIVGSNHSRFQSLCPYEEFFVKYQQASPCQSLFTISYEHVH